jgi:hypothetical protein
MATGTAEPNLRFVEVMANPHSWLLTADNLHGQALALYAQRGRSALTLVDRTEAPQTWDGVNRSVFLLGGFAIENAIKAFLVYENPHWISNGHLSRELRSHRLTHLQARSRLIPFKRRDRGILAEFEAGLESWARYPCGLTAETSEQQKNMHHQLWAGYRRLMAAYGKRLVVLLQKEWRGPHGFRGRWTFQGQFLASSGH